MQIREVTKTDIMNRTDEEKRNLLGRLGEDIVANYYSQREKVVVRSVNQFDPNKDLLIEKYKIEVKTMVPLISEDAFTFRNSQLQKCKEVDLVYFVSVPAIARSHYSFGKVYRIRSEKMKYQFYWKDFGPRGKAKMVKVPIQQEGMEYVFTCTEEECKLLIEYSTSAYNRMTIDG